MRHLPPLLLTALCLTFTTCSPVPCLLAQIEAEGELRVVTRNSPTTYYFGPDGETGPEYELAARLAERLGVQLHVYTVPRFGQILDDVSTRRAHLAAAALSVTDQRLARVQFGPAYQHIRPQLIYRRGSGSAPEDLLAARIEIVRGSAHVDALQRLRADIPELEWHETDEREVDELLGMVAQGDLDYTVADSNEFQIARHVYPDLDAAFDLGPDEPIAWAMPKCRCRQLRERISAMFAEIDASGELAALQRRYFDPTQDYDYVSTRAFVRHFDARLPRYRAYFVEAAADTGIDWRLLAAVGYQESHWDPNAVSPTGVRGIMMLTQRTAGMLDINDREDPRQSIIGGAIYLRMLHDRIPDRIPEPDRTWMALAAYNIGWGHLEDARVIAEIRGLDPDNWEDVRSSLPLLTQRQWYARVRRGYARGWQPVHYIDNIQRYYNILQWMTAGEMQPPPDEDGDDEPIDDEVPVVIDIA